MVSLSHPRAIAAAEKMPVSSRNDDSVMVIPAYNEALGVGSVIDDLRRDFTQKILVVTRPSTDGTEEAARQHGAEVIQQPGRGKGDAIRAALQYISQHYPSVLVVGLIDADCTYATAQLPLMRSVLMSHPSIGMVVGARSTFRNNGVRSLSYALGNHTLARLHSWLNSVSMRDPLSGLRLIRVEALYRWTPRAAGFDIECEINHHVQNDAGLEVAEIPVEYRQRVGRKKLGIVHGFRILARIFQLRFQARPTAPE